MSSVKMETDRNTEAQSGLEQTNAELRMKLEESSKNLEAN